MTAAAIQAQLVDVRNLGTEKCIKMTLHVPAEQAMQVLEAFGWPTAVNPVPVAIARLEIGTHSRPIEPPRQETKANPEPVGASKSWHDLPPAQQAGILAREPAFYTFLYNRTEVNPQLQEYADSADMMSEACGRLIRGVCGVKSRAEIRHHTDAAVIWRGLVSGYRAWMREPEVV